MNGVIRRRTAVAVAVLVVLAAVVGGVYGYRTGRWFSGVDHATMQMASPIAAAPDNAGPSPGGVARGDPSIDPRRQQLIGVRLAPVTRESMSTFVRTTGVVRYDETRLTDVNVKLEGWIRDLRVNYTGELVRRGQPLFTLYSPDLLATQNEYLLALKTRDQMQTSQVADARDYANRLVEAARQRLTLWDLSAEQLATLERSREPLDAVTFTSPANGFVVEKAAVQGMHITPGQTLYKLADVSSVWVEADIYEQDIARVRIGQFGTVTLDAHPGESFTGRVIYIYPFVEENSRTVKMRFAFPNARGRLKPGMFADVELQAAGGMALTVPANAVLDSGTQQVVFVSRGEGTFTPRTVKVGRRGADRVEVIEGLQEGERVAMSATFFLDSESQLRAGLQNYEPSPSADGASSRAGPVASLDIAFRSMTDPPKAGDNVFEVSVKDADGRPLADADVSVTLFMPAMPTMSMPAMRNQVRLPPVGAGVYRGPGQVLMGGRWEATVSVSKDGRQLGSRQFPLVAK
jgi:Cu(I)/Ag(I) efflux system membrane fusion protein/cobalt-zinc-cadmium efflux system membrane fusion protein